jgi:4-carboxymuconolactone decarboxylase
MSEGTAGARAAGMAKMDEVYGFSVDPDTVDGPYVDVTVDHLFGAIWTREALDVRDRRMVTIGVLAALGQANLLEIQFRSALERGELTEEQVRELVLHLAHYIGWPLSTGVNAAAEKIIAERAKAAKVAKAATAATATAADGTEPTKES